MKKYVSNTEEARLPFEEPYKGLGDSVSPLQIWRDGSFIKGSPSEHTFIDNIAYYKNGAQDIPLIKFFEKMPLATAIEGTDSCAYYNENLIDTIGYRFENISVDSGKSWEPIIYINNTQLSYKLGEPEIDPTSGVLVFKDKSYIENLKKASPAFTVSISFYKYIGKKGFFGYDTGDDFPFRDDHPLVKNASEAALTTATFKSRGAIGKNTNYIFPPTSKTTFTDGKGYFGKSLKKEFEEEKNSESSVVVLEENINSLLYAIGSIDGGVF